MTPKAFHALFGRIGVRAKMPFPVHPHMLRHGCGYALANANHDTRSLQGWLGRGCDGCICEKLAAGLRRALYATDIRKANHGH
jgi:integrase